jgi:hypothetical protein
VITATILAAAHQTDALGPSLEVEEIHGAVAVVDQAIERRQQCRVAGERLVERGS